MENFPPAMIDTGGKIPLTSLTSMAALPSVSPLSVLVHIGKDVTTTVVDIGGAPSAAIILANLQKNIIWGGAKKIQEK
jgi:hypothetical protein